MTEGRVESELSYAEAEAILRRLSGPIALPAEETESAEAVPTSSSIDSQGKSILPKTSPLELTVEIFRGLIEAIPDALAVIDRSGHIVLINAQTEVLFGYRRDELIGHSIEVLIPERLHDLHVTLRDGYLAAPHVRPMGKGKELVGRRKDGHEVPVEISLSPLVVETGLLVVSTIRDVSDRRRADAHLRKLEARYRSLVEGIPAVTFMAPMEGEGPGELYVSPQIESLLGFSQREWVENPILWYTQLHHDDKERWHEEFARTVATGEPFRSVYRFIARDGSVVWVHGEAQVVRDDTGRPLFLQGVAFDITGIKQAEEDLKALNATLDQRVAQRTEMAEQRAQELVRSNAALAEYARVAAHDLSSPLLTIQGLIQRLENNHSDKLDDKARADIGRVVKAGVRMKTLIDDLLAYSKVRTEGKPPEPVDCSWALEAACGNLGAAFDESGAEVTADELPTVLADPTQLAQVFQNLIGNALKYRSDRPPRIHVRARRDQPDWWAIDVSDNGIGIDTNSLQKIFKLGIQSRLVSASVVPGSGIGLATCETIVQRHGGRICATSEGSGKGTTISFTMPSSSGGKEGM